MQRSFCFVNDHLVASPDEDSNSPSVGAFLYYEHLLTRGAKAHFADDARFPELAGREVLEARDNAPVGGDGYEFNFWPANPADSGKFVLEEEMVRFVVEAPLTYHQVCTSVFDLLDHFDEFVLFVRLKFAELFDRRDVELVLGLWLGRLESAGQNGEFGVLYFVWHLRVREIFVDDNAFDEKRVFQ